MKAKNGAIEVWKVVIKSKSNFDQRIFYVSATSAAKAEKRALLLEKKNEDKLKQPYCSSANFEHYVE